MCTPVDTVTHNLATHVNTTSCCIAVQSILFTTVNRVVERMAKKFIFRNSSKPLHQSSSRLVYSALGLTKESRRGWHAIFQAANDNRKVTRTKCCGNLSSSHVSFKQLLTQATICGNLVVDAANLLINVGPQTLICVKVTSRCLRHLPKVVLVFHLAHLRNDVIQRHVGQNHPAQRIGAIAEV